MAGYKLTATKVKNLKEAGMYSDGNGLYLQVTKSLKKNWILLFTQNKRRREMWLGSALIVSLQEARALAYNAKKEIQAGNDPIIKRQNEKAAMTFEQAANGLFDNIADDWKSDKQRAKWRNYIDNHCKPIANIQVKQLRTEHVLKIIKPMWNDKPETARTLRSMIERVYSYAKANEQFEGQNPALWRGHLDAILPKPKRLIRGHHKSMAYDEIPSFLELCRKANAASHRALEFTILTASRTSQVLGARWEEFELEGNKPVWRIPAKRMKMTRDHTIPLTGRTLEILKLQAKFRTNDFVFPSVSKKNKPLSNMAMLEALRSFEGYKYTVHGFRSSFASWLREKTTFDKDLGKYALAHKVGDDVEQAYFRSDLLEKRRQLMKAWESFCMAKPADVVRLHG